MAHILGKVTAHGDEPSGPDVLLDLVVEREWLREARTIDIELPRHLCCASCQGAGCSVCGHSGALTLRGRAELGEIVRVTLPQQDPDSLVPPESTRVLTLKVPGHGGLPAPESARGSRGRLLIRISTNGPVSSCIRAVPAVDQRDEPIPSAVLSVNTPAAAAMADRERPVVPPPASARSTQSGAESLSKTTRSVIPPVPRQIQQAQAKKFQSTKAVVEPSIGWTWKDTLIGLVVLVLGAVAAWVFISP